MKILAVYAIKGGVGKTAAAVNLAYEAAQSGARVALWDLDPQGASTFYFRVKAKVRGGGAKLVYGESDLLDHVKATDYENLDIIPSDFSYRNLDINLDEMQRPTYQLKRILKSLEDEYDYVILDCPPGITLLSENVMRAADALLVPVIPTTLSVLTLEQLQDFKDRSRLPKLKILPFLSMVDRRRAMQRDVSAGFYRKNKGALKAMVPSCTSVERMGLERAPVQTFAGNSEGAKAFNQLWKQVAKKVG
ncbi:ParA family protein [Govanella unica]|uniref:AAA family ATPase n=1 Tax=Govanella unica TaxID=2975056 RepID=A0A9X3Z6J0_9PROT|nr:AAA family ATPase [Govania unica]MDA5193186.1 AAA family ATPase [Govania unica]